MNYWIVDAGNLSECAYPLFDMIREVSDEGREVAREHYGVQNGWVFHQNTDLWRVAAPMDGVNWGAFPTGGAWLCTHIWEHYLSTGDKEFLKDYYKELKGSAEFFLDFLVEHPESGWLVTSPSTSPENSPASPGNGRYFDEINAVYYKDGTKICYGSTIDTQILLDLFSYVAQASEILGIDEEFRKRVLETRSRLSPMKVGKDGSLQEWFKDWPQLEEKHRHLSPLYGLYPGSVISPVKTPELIEPAKKVLEQRGDERGAWTRAWKMCLWSRLFDGNRANKIFKGYLKDVCLQSLFAKGGVMQVDGTFGISAAVTEMLIQSNESYLHFLPAIPDTWLAEGRFSGVVTRGAFELDYTWEEGMVKEVKLLSKAGNDCRIKSDSKPNVTLDGKKVQVRKEGDGIYSFTTRENEVYQIKLN